MTAGIYSIKNLITGDEYIGSSVSIDQRIKGHFHNLQQGKHFNLHLQSSWNKYGKDAFISETLEETVQLRDRELFWINQYHPSFNCDMAIVRKDPDGLGFCHSEETRRKISETKKSNGHLKGRHQSEETKRKISEAQKGKPKWSSEERQNISDNQKGRHLSFEIRTKISKSHKGKQKSIEWLKNISEAAKGKIHTEETRKKISKSIKKWWQMRKGVAKVFNP